jgi:hypothetical protein
LLTLTTALIIKSVPSDNEGSPEVVDNMRKLRQASVRRAEKAMEATAERAKKAA